METAMKRKRVTLTGVTGLIMHSTTTLNPMHPISKQIKAATSKKSSTRTDDDHIELQRLEFMAGLYIDEKAGPHIPTDMLLATIRDGGKAQKLGAEVTRSVFIEERICPLDYEGPRTAKGLWDKGFYDVRSVKVGAARVSRCRPIFQDWKVHFTIVYDPEHLDPAQMTFCIENAGARVGLGDYRPRYGRFDAEIVDV